MAITDGFNHVATLTTDLDRFTAWYLQVFEAPVVFEMAAEGDHPRMAIVDLGGGSALNVFEVPADSMIGEQRSIGRRGAIDHFGLSVPDRDTLDQVRDRLIAAEADIGEIQQLGDCWSLFFRDVDGMELEVCAPLG
jgi:catechol 2,3-dioxygenase-like lactoylglutathione lyase family enzyme